MYVRNANTHIHTSPKATLYNKNNEHTNERVKEKLTHSKHTKFKKAFAQLYFFIIHTENKTRTIKKNKNT